jgi:hypothetical protein
MRMPLWISSLLALLALSGCSTLSVTSDYDNSYNLNAYKTYRWMQNPPSVTADDALSKNPLIYKRVKFAVKSELAAKGLVLKESGPVDFTVAVHAGVREYAYVYPQPSAAFYYHRGHYRGGRFGGGYSPWGWDYYGYAPVRYYEQGTLVVDFYDARTNEISWRGMATGIVQDYSSNEQMQKDINDAVARILAKFPPIHK